MKKILQGLKQHKEILIAVGLLLTLFFIILSILFSANKTVVSDYKKQLEESRIEKENYQKKIIQLNDSITYWESQAQIAINHDTIFILKIKNQKIKTNEELTTIANLADSTSLELHAKLCRQYIQTGFEPDSAK